MGDAVYNVKSRYITVNPLCAQLVTPVETVFMTASHPSIRSFPISIFSFEFRMNTAMCRAPLSETDAGPLLSYVREDDTHETLVSRLEVLIGEGTDTDWESLRLAVVSPQNVPHFLPRARAASPRALTVPNESVAEAKEQEKEKESEEEGGGHYVIDEGIRMEEEALPQEQEQENMVWKLFQQHYPDLFAEDGRSSGGLGLLNGGSLPLLGLQHPTAEQPGGSKGKGNGNGGSSARGVRRGTSGVKIN